MKRGVQKTYDPLVLDGGSLGLLDFRWNGDRYRHQWRLGDEVLLESIEGPLKTPWPDAPPLQQVHLQSFDDGRQVIFGVGMAGRGHWSASCTLVPSLQSWIVELACRSPVTPDRLASSYRGHSNWLWNNTEGSSSPTGMLQIHDKQVRIEPIGPSSLFINTDGVLEVRPNHIQTAAPATIQWAFRLTFK